MAEFCTTILRRFSYFRKVARCLIYLVCVWGAFVQSVEMAVTAGFARSAGQDGHLAFRRLRMAAKIEEYRRSKGSRRDLHCIRYSINAAEQANAPIH